MKMFKVLFEMPWPEFIEVVENTTGNVARYVPEKHAHVIEKTVETTAFGKPCKKTICYCSECGIEYPHGNYCRGCGAKLEPYDWGE